MVRIGASGVTLSEMVQNLKNSYSDSSSTTSSSEEEEDFIDMEVDDEQHSSIFNQSSSNEFEFQQSFSSSSDRDPHATTSPADELFYMGKLLPLHLPPRIEMVHKILHNYGEEEEEEFATPLFTPTATTPFESCNISPSESCEVSRELSPHDYLAEYGDEKKSWTKKMKMMKQPSSSSSKIKWTSFIKSLFSKSSGCTNEHSAAADHRQFPKAKQSLNKSSTTPFGQIKYNKHSNLVEDQRARHRRSFSGAIKRLSKPKSPTNINLLAFKSSASETESPIQAAIAHCKRSQNSRQIADEGRFYSVSAGFHDQERVCMS